MESIEDRKEQIDISVIVPVYNVEEYLCSSIDSLLKQGQVSLEAIFVDDGSTDASGEIIDEYAKKYDWMHAFHKQNAGAGSARNYGVSYANGKYIAFLDPDDILKENIYERMFRTAEHNQTELTICNAVRFNSKSIWSSGLHVKSFHYFETVTHITRNSMLIYDTSPCNKLILRSFYLKHGLLFPERTLYEDVAFAIQLHYLCSSVSMIAEPGYFWRVRDGQNKSVTQRTASLVNLTDRIKILQILNSFFEEQRIEGDQKLVEQLKELQHDLLIFANEVDQMDREQAQEVFRIINSYLDDTMDEAAFSHLSPCEKQRYEFIRKNDVDSYIKLLDFIRTDYYQTPVAEENGRLLAEYPKDLFTISERDITKEMASYQPRVSVKDICKEGDFLTITAYAYYRRYNMSEEDWAEWKAELVNEETDHHIPLKVERASTRFLTDRFGKLQFGRTGEVSNYNYDGVGFRVFIDLNKLEESECPDGIYSICVDYKNRLFEGRVILAGINSAKKDVWQGRRSYCGDLSVTVDIACLDQIRLILDRTSVIAEELTIQNDEIVCVLNKEASELYLVKEESADNKEWIAFTKESDHRFTVKSSQMEFGQTYAIKTADNSRLFCQPIYSRTQDVTILADQRGVGVVSCVSSNIPNVCRFRNATRITSSTKEKARFILDTELLGAPEDAEKVEQARLFVYDAVSRRNVLLAASDVTMNAGKRCCHFEVDFKRKKITKNFYESTRELKIRYVTGSGANFVNTVLCEEQMNHVYSVRDNMLEIQYFRSNMAVACLGITRRWPGEQNSAEKRKILIAENYPKYREEPIDEKCILFESMWGSEYSSNPQAIYEYIDKTYPNYTCVWSLKDEFTPIRGEGHRVRKGSLEYYHYLATAKYLINNVNFEDEFVKRPEQIMIQTMHGTPLKKYGLDVSGDFQTIKSRDKYIAGNAIWDYILVQGSFMENKIVDCFGVKTKALTCGYPRTDKLFHYSEKEKTSIKKKLGIPLNKKIILYTPTWRVREFFEIKLDLERMKAELEEEYIILVRLPQMTKNCSFLTDHEFVWNLTDYQYAEELYMITDILITDYSSAMCDFSLLKKPILFYVYDLQDYRGKRNGLYMDLEKEAPGPLLYDTVQIIEAIRKESWKNRVFKHNKRAFKQKYLTYENGNSCKSIMKQIFQK